MAEQKEQKGKRLKGVVSSDKMKDSAVVDVTRFEKHPRYGKFVRSVKKFMAHDPENVHKVGDDVVIEETRPISKRKSFKIVDSNE